MHSGIEGEACSGHPPSTYTFFWNDYDFWRMGTSWWQEVIVSGRGLLTYGCLWGQRYVSTLICDAI